MSPITLDMHTERQLDALSKRTGKTPVQIIQEALQAYIEDMDDMQASADVLGRMERGEEPTMSLLELETRLGLDG